MPAPRRWIRIDVGWSDSEWLADLSPAGRLAWVELLTYVKSEGLAGVAKRLAPTVFARKYAIPVGDVVAMLEAAIGDGAVMLDDESWIITGWPDYQETDPRAADRQKKFRAERSRLSTTKQNRPVSVDNAVTANITNGKPVTPVTVDDQRDGRDTTVTRRATETETYTETDKINAVSSETGKPTDLSDGELMALVRKRFYVPDNKPPTNYQEGREFSCFKYLRAQGRSGQEIADHIEGAALIRDAGGLVNANIGRVDWLESGSKLTMRALVNAKSGVTQLWQLAEIKLAETTGVNGKARTTWGNGAVNIRIERA